MNPKPYLKAIWENIKLFLNTDIRASFNFNFSNASEDIKTLNNKLQAKTNINYSRKLEKEISFVNGRCDDIEDRVTGDYDEVRTALKELFRDFENEIYKLKKQNSILKSRITRQTNEQNREKKAFLYLMSRTENEFNKVLEKC